MPTGTPNPRPLRVPCEPDEAARALEMLNATFAWPMESTHLLVEVQAVAHRNGYQLVNPRFEWVAAVDPRYEGERARHLLCDGVQRMEL